MTAAPCSWAVGPEAPPLQNKCTCSGNAVEGDNRMHFNNAFRTRISKVFGARAIPWKCGPESSYVPEPTASGVLEMHTMFPRKIKNITKQH